MDKNPNNNAFIGRTDGYIDEGVKFEDVDVVTYGLELKAVPLNDGSGESVIQRVPVEIDRYKMQKVIDERTKGADLESLVARVTASGDLTLLSQKKAIYGDGYKYPRNMAEALNKGIEADNKFASLSPETLSLIQYVSSMTDQERKAFFSKKAEPVKTNEDVTSITESIGGEK